MPITFQHLQFSGGGGSSQFPIDLIFPVGSVITNSNASFDPNKLYEGTTWVRIKGKVVVGVDESDNSFKTVNKTGGHKELQSHTHTGSTNTAGGHTHSGRSDTDGSHSHYTGLRTISSEAGTSGMAMENPGSFAKRVVVTPTTAYTPSSESRGDHYHQLTINSAGSHSHTVTINSSGSGNGGNLPPYITKYVWERTA